MDTLGIRMIGGTPQDFDKHPRRDGKMGYGIRKAGIKPEAQDRSIEERHDQADVSHAIALLLFPRRARADRRRFLPGQDHHGFHRLRRRRRL